MTDQKIVERLAREVMDYESHLSLWFPKYDEWRKPCVFDPLTDANDTWRCVDALEARYIHISVLPLIISVRRAEFQAIASKVTDNDRLEFVRVAFDLNRNRAICLAMLAALDAEKEQSK